MRNRKVNAALIQGVETAQAVLETTPQGQSADAQFVKWLKEHQKEAGVFTTVSTLVENLSDNPAAKLTAQEIVERVQKAEQLRSASATATTAPVTQTASAAPVSTTTPTSPTASVASAGCASGHCVIPATGS